MLSHKDVRLGNHSHLKLLKLCGLKLRQISCATAMR